MKIFKIKYENIQTKIWKYSNWKYENLKSSFLVDETKFVRVPFLYWDILLF